MARKGYAEELLAKHELVKEYGKSNVIKVAICGAQDFIIVKPFSRELLKVVEVKACHGAKYYPSARDLAQFERIASFCKEHSIPAELWVKYPRKVFEKRGLYP